MASTTRDILPDLRESEYNAIKKTTNEGRKEMMRGPRTNNQFKSNANYYEQGVIRSKPLEDKLSAIDGG